MSRDVLHAYFAKNSGEVVEARQLQSADRREKRRKPRKE